MYLEESQGKARGTALVQLAAGSIVMKLWPKPKSIKRKTTDRQAENIIYVAVTKLAYKH